jgi:prepilin-type N-terminal cleavage/methylation domain-containing protein
LREQIGEATAMNDARQPRLLFKAVANSTCASRFARVRRSEDGFTLIELVIVLVIMPIIVGGVAAAIIASLQNQGTEYNRLADSSDAQITSTNFVRDVQSATSLVQSGATQCGIGNAYVLGLQWNQETIFGTLTDGSLVYSAGSGTDTLSTSPADFAFSPSDQNKNVSDGGINFPGNPVILSVNPVLNSITFKSTQPLPGTILGEHATLSFVQPWLITYWSDGTQLVRNFCLGSQFVGGAPKLLTSTILAHDLPANLGPAVITCLSGYAPPCSLSGGGTIGTADVQNVSLSISEPASGYQFSLSALPRNVTGAGQTAGTLSIPALFILGNGNPGALNLSPGTSLNVNGEIAFNMHSSPDVAFSPFLSTLSDTNGPFNVVGCGSPCSVNSVFNIPSDYPAGDPAPSSASPALPTPIVDPPPNPAVAGSCQIGGVPATPPFPKNAMVTCSPGKYPAGLTLTKPGITLTFQAGNYSFGGPVQDFPASTVNFGPGQYTFDAGLGLNSKNDKVAGSGVLFYVEAGQVGLGTDQTKSLSLSPATSGPYTGILLYQVVADSSALTVSANSTSAETLSGAIEAPHAAVSLVADSSILNLGLLAAQSVSLNSSGAPINITN